MRLNNIWWKKGIQKNSIFKGNSWYVTCLLWNLFQDSTVSKLKTKNTDANHIKDEGEYPEMESEAKAKCPRKLGTQAVQTW